METKLQRSDRVYEDKPRQVVVTPEVHAKLVQLKPRGESIGGFASVILSDFLSDLEQSRSRKRTVAD